MKGKVWLQAVVAGTTTAALAATILLVFQPTAGPRTVPDMHGNSVVVEGDFPSPATVAAMDAQSDIGERFHIPSVGLDVPLGALDETAGAITPPEFTSAYLVRNRGESLADASAGTVFVVMHSIRGDGVAPGNYLVDSDAGRSKVVAGATITVGDRSYRVARSITVPKAQLPFESEVWADQPGRLVVITCLKRADGGPAVDNLVLFADLA